MINAKLKAKLKRNFKAKPVFDDSPIIINERAKVVYNRKTRLWDEFIDDIRVDTSKTRFIANKVLVQLLNCGW